MCLSRHYRATPHQIKLDVSAPAPIGAVAPVLARHSTHRVKTSRLVVGRIPLLVAAIGRGQQTADRTQQADELPFSRVVDHALQYLVFLDAESGCRHPLECSKGVTDVCQRPLADFEIRLCFGIVSARVYDRHIGAALGALELGLQRVGFRLGFNDNSLVDRPTNGFYFSRGGNLK
ncbi:hypothetical protein SAMN05192552_10722 [Natrinema hispanicum]|uniref:Uncharacterized protein n=1 Tax=Natrinema hispanicum TaxID=392421 RepID=A0A1I0JN65_9EURY|nr:hypothetical protein SAMN05192552_10722 [Natrinema hispanicum]SEU11882.1 hypothetical protein SAMN04488694_15112 [Natrinema hispanicum]